MTRILVINPNSSVSMTASIDEGLENLRIPGGPEIVTTRLVDAPEGIESQEDVETVVLPLLKRVKEDPADAYVIACYSDPGLYLLREEINKPIFGIAESSVLFALGLGYKFGIVAIADRSIGRHLRMVRSLGQEHRLAGDIAANTGLEGLEDSSNAIERIVAVGKRLRDERGADVLILGCAGMGRYRPEIEEATGLPVVDPTQAAVARAIGFLQLGYPRAR